VWASEPNGCRLDEYEGDQIALVAGTNDYSRYQSEGVTNLENAINDAKTMADLLSKQGFKVRCLLNPTQQGFDDEKVALGKYLLTRERSNEADTDAGRVVIYIAGHGYNDPESKQDYVLFNFEPDETKYSGLVDLRTLRGKIAEGRFAIQALMQAFSVFNHAVIFIFDACRATLDVGQGVAAGPASRLKDSRLSNRQVLLYSTQQGGVAADNVPNSSEANGLYTSTLSRFMSLSIFSQYQMFGLTASVVEANKEDQLPALSASSNTLFLRNPWFEGETTNPCDILDTDIWNSVGRTCQRLQEATCIRKDVCKVISPHLRDASSAQAIACLERHKTHWLHNDLANICGASSPMVAPSNAVGPVVVDSSTASGGGNPGDLNAYNVVSVQEAAAFSENFAKTALTGWADKTPSLFTAANKISPEVMASIQGTVDKQLGQIVNSSSKRSFTEAQRDLLITRSDVGGVPQHAAPSPFQLDLKGRTIALRNLPSSNSGLIGTFDGNEVSAEIDCYTLPCINGWVGVRVIRNKNILRGWASADELESVTSAGISITVRYSLNSIVPDAESAKEIHGAVRPDEKQPLPKGRIQVITIRSGATTDVSSFLAGARLSYLDRLLIDLGASPDDIVKTVVDVPDASQFPAAILNLGPSYTNRH
jgi:hypothetical protein